MHGTAINLKYLRKQRIRMRNLQKINLVFLSILISLILHFNPKTTTATESGSSENPINPSCTPPVSGDWIISEDCFSDGEGVEFREGNIIIKSGATLTVTKNAQIALDLEEHQIYIEKGGHMLIKLGGKVISGYFPTAKDNFQTTPINSAIDINVLGGVGKDGKPLVYDKDLNPFHIEILTDGIHGNVTDIGDGFLRYVPESDFTGKDFFTYTILDVYGLKKTATVNIIVEGPDFSPDDYWKFQGNTLYYNGEKTVGIGTANVPSFYKLFINGDTIADNIRIRRDAVVDGNTTTGTLKITGNTDIDKISIGSSTTPEGYRLSVNGKIISSGEVRVEHQITWPDHVFENDFKLRSLTDLEKYITEHKRLPGLPSVEEVRKDGFSLGTIQAQLLQKVEELTLDIIEQDKQIRSLQKADHEVQELEKIIYDLQNRLSNFNH